MTKPLITKKYLRLNTRPGKMNNLNDRQKQG